jgi:hypothetical protein
MPATAATSTQEFTMPGTTLRKIKLPPLEAYWQWPRYVSPHLNDVEQECLEWSASFGAFDPHTQKLIHDYGKLSMSFSTIKPRTANNGLTRYLRPPRRHVLCTHAAG